MSPAGGAVLERESPRSETANKSRPSTENQVRGGQNSGASTLGESSLAVNDRKISLSSLSPSNAAANKVDVLSLHAAYGNAAVAHAAKQGEMEPAPTSTPTPTAMAGEVSPAARSAVLITPALTVAGTRSAPAVSRGLPSKSSDALATAGKAGTEKTEDAGQEASAKAGSVSANSDPAFQAVVRHAKAAAKQQARHATASAKVSEAHAAAVSPANEVSSRAAAKQTDKMDRQQPKPFDKASFKDALLKKIAATAPKTLEEADDFKDSGKLEGVKGDLTGNVKNEKEQSQGAVAQATTEKPDATGIEPKPVTPLAPAETAPVASVSATGAAPKPQSDAAISLADGPKEVDKQMTDAGVTEEQLQKSNEPAFQDAVSQKKAAEKDAATAPAEYRKQEAATLAGARAEAQVTASTDLAAIHGTRTSVLAGVSGRQTESKQEEEKKRLEVANHIEQIYEKTKKSVEDRLQKLDEDVNKIFDDGATTAQKNFEDYVGARMDAYKDDRYSGWTGGFKWGKDKLFGMPDEVNEFYQQGHDRYITEMDGVIDRVATAVETGLNEAKVIIDAGQKEIETYVHGLPLALQAAGKEAESSIHGKFDALEQSVNEKQDQLVDSLAKKYNDNLTKLNDRIEEMKAANRGLVDGAIAAIKGVIKTILALKDMLLNVLSRAAGAIGLIVAHPIDFLGHLVDAGKLGFSNFTDHIVEHLKKGFMEWLFGAVAETGITLPDNFDLPGILSIILQVLGLTYANIRARAVRILGEKVVKALETAAEIFKVLITKGPAGLWEYIKEKIGDLKTMVIEKIKSFVMEKIIIAGITWIIGLLNPASAFIKACKAIYDIIMFFVEHGKQIIDLINAIIDSITSIAKGAIGAAAAFVEGALAKGIPVAIGFLAALLGVGGISEKIKDVIQAIREPINAAIDWVINKAVDIIKGAGGLLGFGKKEDKTKTEDPEHELKVNAGLIAIEEEEKKYAPEGKISHEDAEKVAGKVQQDHPIFKSITVVAGEETWDYNYEASKGRKTGDKRKEGHAANWDEVQKVLGKKVPPEVKLPDGYQYYYTEDKQIFIRRLDADDKKYEPLTVDDNSQISIGHAKSNRISTPGKLAGNLQTPEDYQAHHLIPDAVVRDHPLTQQAMKRGDPRYELDEGSNGISLPATDKAKKDSPNLPMHRGSHPQWNERAFEKLNAKFDSLREKYGGIQKVPDDVLTRSVRQVEDSLRKEIVTWKEMK